VSARRPLPSLPTPVEVSAGGVSLRVRRFGPPERDSPRSARLIAFHGGPGLDHHLLIPLALVLAERFEVWLPDLPGHGGSVAPSGKLPGLKALEGRLAAWLRGVCACSARGCDILLGHSLGAWLVARLLRRRKVEPAAVVLLSPPAAGQASDSTALRRAVRAMGELERGSRANRARRELQAHVLAETRGEASDTFLAAIERTDVRDPRLYGALLRNFHRSVTGPVRPFEPPCPVLVVCGEEDRTTPPDQARRVARSIAGARLSLLEGAGHYPFAERPAETAGSVLEFLDAVLDRAAPAGHA